MFSPVPAQLAGCLVFAPRPLPRRLFRRPRANAGILRLPAREPAVSRAEPASSTQTIA